MSLVKEGLVDIADSILEKRKVEIDHLKAHNAMVLAEISAHDKKFIFDKLRKKIKDAATVIAKSKVTNVVKDMQEVAVVRQESEALFGKFQIEEQQDVRDSVRPSQLTFLIGTNVSLAAPSHTEKPVVAQVIPAQTERAEPPLLEPTLGS